LKIVSNSKEGGENVVLKNEKISSPEKQKGCC
jgi:hypothetical protein